MNPDLDSKSFAYHSNGTMKLFGINKKTIGNVKNPKDGVPRSLWTASDDGLLIANL